MQVHRQRKAFSMLTAIFVIVIMATVGAMVMSLSGKLVKETTTQYQREQAMLLAKSYTEYAVLAVMANDRNTSDFCLTTINSDNIFRNDDTDGGFEVRVQIAYIGNNSGELNSCPITTILSNAAVTPKSPLNIIIDVYVIYRDFDSSNTNDITYHKRTLQKI